MPVELIYKKNVEPSKISDLFVRKNLGTKMSDLSVRKNLGTKQRNKKCREETRMQDLKNFDPRI